VTVTGIEEPGQHEMRGMYGGYSMSRESSARAGNPTLRPPGHPCDVRRLVDDDPWRRNLVYDPRGAEGRRKTFRRACS